MSSVRNDFNPEAKITYMSTAPFDDDFWSYSLTWNQAEAKYIGTLSAVSGATSGTCPAKRFLHETGKKLFPSANPGIKTMLVGVYDPVSFLKGYIDPNSEVFLRMNNDRAANIDTLNPADNEANLRSIHGEFALRPGVDSIDYGQPVYTRGNVVALGSATITGDIDSLTGDITAEAGAVTAQTNVSAVTGNITAPLGNIVAGNRINGGTKTLAPINFNIQDIAIDISGSGYPNNLIIPFTKSPGLGPTTGYSFGFTTPAPVPGVTMNVFLQNTTGGSIGFDFTGVSNVTYAPYFTGLSLTVANNAYLVYNFVSSPSGNWVLIGAGNA